MRHQYEMTDAASTIMPSMKYDIATTSLGVSVVYIIK